MKYSDTNPVVENEDFVIVYQLVNLGSATATSIDVADRYDPNSFDLIGNFDEEGVFSTEFEELTAGKSPQNYGGYLYLFIYFY